MPRRLSESIKKLPAAVRVAAGSFLLQDYTPSASTSAFSFSVSVPVAKISVAPLR